MLVFWLLVFGGAVGVLCRFLVVKMMLLLGGYKPLGNLFSNWLGVALLALIWPLLSTPQQNEWVLLLLGATGGLSTLSGIWVDVYQLAQERKDWAILYFLATVLGGGMVFTVLVR